MDVIDIIANVYGADADQYRQEMRDSMVQAGLYLLGYELLRSSIVQGVKDFFTNGWDAEKGPILSEGYQQMLDQVPEGTQGRVEAASMRWLVKVSAITEDEAKELQRIRGHRNKIAHQLPTLMLTWKEGSQGLDLGLLHRVPYFLDKIDRFWATIDMDVAEEQYEDYQYEGAVSPRSLIYAAIYWDIMDRMPEIPEFWSGAVEGWAPDEFE